MAKTIRNDRFATWDINGDNATWTLAGPASITVHNEPAINVRDTSVANTLKLLGDLTSTGEDGEAVHVTGVNTRIVIGKQAELTADDGIHAAANGLDVVNRGDINGLALGIVNGGSSDIRNFGDISGNIAVSMTQTSTVVNGKNGTIQGDLAGVSMTFGSDSTIINHGMISGNDFAIRLLNGGETKLVNTGTIHGDIELGNADGLLDSSKGLIKGTITDQGGDDVYKIGGNDVMIVEDAGGGNDSVHSTISRILADNIENLVLVGKKDIYGTGNDEDNHLTGNKGDNTLQGGQGDDVIGGGRGDDVLAGDDGLDTFIFKLGGDHDVITDFVKGEDTISLVGFENAESFEALQTEMFKNGSDVWIQLGNGDRLIIQNVDVADLEASDFNFVV